MLRDREERIKPKSFLYQKFGASMVINNFEEKNIIYCRLVSGRLGALHINKNVKLLEKQNRFEI